MHLRPGILLLSLFFSFYSHGQMNRLHYNSVKKVVCEKAAVVCAHPLASQAGIEMLRKGGNAFDAVIATQLALAVVYPNAGNIGGGGFMVAHLQNGKNLSLDFREKAGSKAHKDMYLDSLGNALGELSKTGHLAVGVPGTIAGIFATFKYAKLPFQTLIRPAIELAENGFAITNAQAMSLNDNRELFVSVNKILPAFVRTSPWKGGDLLIQPDLAATLKRISKNGEKEFYQGQTAKLMITEMRRGNGIITAADLKSYKAVQRKPVEFDYKDVHVVSVPLPSSGGIMLQQMMKIIETRNIAAMGFHSAEAVQLMVEAERRAYADRAEFLGDMDFVKVPVQTLVSDKYLEGRMKDFIPGKANNSTATKAGVAYESEQTTHISCIDNEGNAVSVTTTLNGSFGSKVVVAGAGFLLNNEMDDFSIKPGVANMYGAIGNEQNAIAANKRMLSSMTPTVVLKQNKPVIVVGTPGGTTIATSVFQTLVNILEFGLDPVDVVSKPKFHHQWIPDTIDVEATFPVNISKQLSEMGYHIKTRDPIGRTELIEVRYEPKKQITAIADHRGDDGAEGF